MLGVGGTDQRLQPELHLPARAGRGPGVEAHAVDQGEGGDATGVEHRALLAHRTAEVVGDHVGAGEAPGVHEGQEHGELARNGGVHGRVGGALGAAVAEEVVEVDPVARRHEARDHLAPDVRERRRAVDQDHRGALAVDAVGDAVARDDEGQWCEVRHEALLLA